MLIIWGYRLYDFKITKSDTQIHQNLESQLCSECVTYKHNNIFTMCIMLEQSARIKKKQIHCAATVLTSEPCYVCAATDSWHWTVWVVQWLMSNWLLICVGVALNDVTYGPSACSLTLRKCSMHFLNLYYCIINGWVMILTLRRLWFLGSLINHQVWKSCLFTSKAQNSCLSAPYSERRSLHLNADKTCQSLVQMFSWPA